MSGKHTPGPWQAVSGIVAREVGCMEIAEVAHMRVIPAGGGWPTAGLPEDDASLMAAAPDLLEALRAARACILIDRTFLADAHTGPEGLDEAGAEGIAEYDATLAQIDAAIAKAEGKTA